jgi:TATA-box binding protein (TBP) (component of TFIID and TFIIIB)
MSIKNTPKISTITISTQLPYCTFTDDVGRQQGGLNLTNIGKYLSIDDDIIGIKYNYADLSIMKGKYSTSIYKKSKYKNIDKIKKTLFYNQITIILNNNGNNVNIKLFGNGSLHLTGCKTEDEGMDITKILYSKLKTINDKNDIILLTKDENGVLIDKDKLVYSYNNYSIIGYKKEDSKYIIHKKEFAIDHKTKMFISTKIEKKRQRPILNFSGDDIGFTKIELFKNRNKFYKKNLNIYIDPHNNFIYYNNSILIGKIEYNIDNAKITNIEKKDDIIEINYSCNPFYFMDNKLEELMNKENVENDFFKKMIDFNINCINIYFTIDYEINRQRLYEQLIKSNFICKYKPESYSGIKLIYKTGLNNNNCKGICFCSDKCTCTNITFLIFQTGNVIATGFKSVNGIENITNHFFSICDSLKDVIKKKKFL